MAIKQEILTKQYIIVDGVAYARTSTGINAAIDALGSSGGEVFLTKGDYDITSSILIDYNNTTIEGVGDGTRLLATNRATFDDATGTLSEGNTITGGVNSYTAIVAKITYNTATTGIIWYRSLSNILDFEDNEVLSSGANNITLNITPTKPNFSCLNFNGKNNCKILDLRIIGSRFNTASVSAIGGAFCEYDVIDNITIEYLYNENSAAGVLGFAWANYCTIKNCRIKNCESVAIAGGAGVENRLIIINNIITGGCNNYAIGGSLEHSIVKGNTIRNTTGVGIQITSHEHNTISNNSIETCGNIGISIWSNYNTIVGNTISDTASGYADIKIINDYNIIIGNNCYGDGTSDIGIWLDEADYCIVEGNYTENHDIAGIQIDSDCDNDSIAGNICKDSTPYINNGTNGKFFIQDSLSDGTNNVKISEIKSIIDGGITSTAGGDEKKITSMTYNPSTGKISVNYQE